MEDAIERLREMQMDLQRTLAAEDTGGDKRAGNKEADEQGEGAEDGRLARSRSALPPR